jgi:hypothetical protein
MSDNTAVAWGDGTRAVTGADIVARVAAAAFGKSLVTNNLRALLVEAMIDAALPANWTWCSADYAGWDFESADGIRMEVKQAAAWQTWSTSISPPSRCSFDIAARTGHYVGANWIARTGRNADIYVLAHHPLTGAAADHREPAQWHFYVVPTHELPATSKSISLSGVRALAEVVDYDGLAERVEAVRRSLAASRCVAPPG